MPDAPRAANKRPKLRTPLDNFCRNGTGEKQLILFTNVYTVIVYNIILIHIYTISQYIYTTAFRNSNQVYFDLERRNTEHRLEEIMVAGSASGLNNHEQL